MPRKPSDPARRLAQAKADYDAAQIAAFASSAGIKAPLKEPQETITGYAARLLTLIEAQAHQCTTASNAIRAFTSTATETTALNGESHQGELA